MTLARHRELVVLGAVRAHAAHGYALVQALGQGLGKAVGLKRPTMYALLQRLEERGWLRHRTHKDSEYPERQVYQTTSKGQRALAGLLRQCVAAGQRPALPLAALLAHLDEVPDDERAEILDTICQQIERDLQDLAELPEHDGLAGEALALLRKHHELDLQTVKRLRAQLP
ncbi:MAG: PadR family transcriptional regulator [Myxococcales bacterium]|nr:PadR family transcriptional regulator [Myxococcales bacterium]